MFCYYSRVVSRAFADTVSWADMRAAIAVLAVAVVCLLIHVSLLRRWPSLKERLGSPIDNWWLWVVYTLVPGVLFTIVLAVVNLVVAPVRIHAEQEQTIAQLTPSEELALLMHSFLTAAGGDNIQATTVTLTNRSEQNMSLSFSLSIDFTNQNGSPGRYLLMGEWNGAPLKPNSGETVVHVPAKSMVEGRLDFYLDDAETKLNSPTWGNEFHDNGTLWIHDLVSGARVLGHPMKYPPAKSLASMESRLAEWRKAKRKQEPAGNEQP